MRLTLSLLAAILLITVTSEADAIELDKKKHLYVSTAIGASTQVYTGDWKKSMVVCTAVGVAKEVYDEIDYGGFDGKDLVADVAGCALGILVGDSALKAWHQDDSVGIQYSLKF